MNKIVSDAAAAVAAIERAPSGKPDYRWAKRVATGEIEA